jgi:hypothetical protein
MKPVFYLLVISAVIILIPACNYAQTSSVYLYGMDQLSRISYSPSKTKSKAIHVESSAFLNKDFLNGELQLKEDSSKMTDLPLNFDIYRGQMQFIHNADTFIVGDPNKIKLITIGGKKFIYGLGFIGLDVADKGYFEIIAEGKIQLLLFRTKELFQDSYASTYMGGAGSGKYYFKDIETLYFKIGDEAPIKFLNSKKQLMKLMTGKEKEIEQYIKTNRLNIKKKQDLLKIIDYYNTLL